MIVLSNRRRKKKKGILAGKGVPFICIVVILCCSVVGVRSYFLYQEKQELEKKRVVLEAHLEAEEERRGELEEREKYMGTKKFVEDTARDHLGLVYPNEIIVQPRD